MDVEITWNGIAATQKVRTAALRGLKMAAELLLSEANQLVPLEEGTLMRSGRATVDAEEMTGIVSYDTSYAVVQHEDLTLYHPNGRQAKYLEEPYLEHAFKFMDIIAGQIRRALSSGGGGGKK